MRGYNNNNNNKQLTFNLKRLLPFAGASLEEVWGISITNCWSCLDFLSLVVATSTRLVIPSLPLSSPSSYELLLLLFAWTRMWHAWVPICHKPSCRLLGSWSFLSEWGFRFPNPIILVHANAIWIVFKVHKLKFSTSLSCHWFLVNSESVTS